jgi:hypothetical protein
MVTKGYVPLETGTVLGCINNSHIFRIQFKTENKE